jgi:hypothetical protein
MADFAAGLAFSLGQVPRLISYSFFYKTTLIFSMKETAGLQKAVPFYKPATISRWVISRTVQDLFHRTCAVEKGRQLLSDS